MVKNGGNTTLLLPMMSSLLLSGVAAVVVTIFLLLAISVLISAGALSQGNELRMTLAAAFLGAFVGGSLVRKRWQRKRLVAGLLSGGVFYLILMTVGAVGYSANAIGENGIGLLICGLCGGGLAGFLGGGKRKKRSKKGSAAVRKRT